MTSVIIAMILLSFQVVGFEKKAIPSNKMIKKIQFQVPGDFFISADYYTGKKGAAGVLLLHNCNSNNQVFFTLGNALSTQGIHALAVNLRGFGASSSAIFSQKNIRSQSDTVTKYQEKMGELTTYWHDDLLAAYQLLRIKVGSAKHIAVVASGCSSIYAARLAEQMKLAPLVLLEPRMTLREKDDFKRLLDTPAYFIGVENDPISYQMSKELFNWNDHEDSKLQLLKNQKTPLLNSRKLSEEISNWLRHSFNQ